jgi:hypothetical protein
MIIEKKIKNRDRSGREGLSRGERRRINKYDAKKG